MHVYQMFDEEENQHIATIVEFGNGKTVTVFETDDNPQSIAVWDNIDDAKEIHSRNEDWKIRHVSTLHIYEGD